MIKDNVYSYNNSKSYIMLKNILNLGRTLSKEEQLSIRGGIGGRICDCNIPDPLEDPGCDEYRCH